MSKTKVNPEIFTELRDTYFQEMKNLKEVLGDLFLKIEDPLFRHHYLGHLYRVVTSIRATSRAVGFEEIGQLAQKISECVTICRAYPDEVNRDCVMLFEKSVYEIFRRIEELEQGAQLKGAWNFQQLMSDLETVSQFVQGKMNRLKLAS